MVDILIDPSEFGKRGLWQLNGKLWSNPEEGVEIAGFEGDGSVERPYEYGGERERFYYKHATPEDVIDFAFPLLSLAGKENYQFFIRAYGVKFAISLEDLGGTKTQTYLLDLDETDPLRVFAAQTVRLLREAVLEYKTQIHKSKRS